MLARPLATLSPSSAFSSIRKSRVQSLTLSSSSQTNNFPVSDLIALGTVMATGACSGPHVQFRGGRVDATTAGPTGKFLASFSLIENL
jgi:hypothetical protein